MSNISSAVSEIAASLVLICSLSSCSSQYGLPENNEDSSTEFSQSEQSSEAQHFSGNDDKESSSIVDGTEDADSLSALKFAENMGIGWNLGNSLDAYSDGKGNETSWGNPQVSEKIIKAVKNAGFDTIRIPVTYMGRIGDAPDYNIDSQWLDRVYEVANTALNNDLYVIIDIHHDGNGKASEGAWIDITQDDQTEMQNKFEAVWKQISEKFKNCSDKLIFESMNEINDGTYDQPTSSGGQALYDSVNSLNQIFVNTVRKSGSENSDRYLLIPGYNDNIQYTIDGFTMPTDTVDDKLMISVHYYDPYQFTLEENKNATGWGANHSGNTSGWGDESYVDEKFELLKSKYIDNGIPVIIGEYGAADKNNDADRASYLGYVTKAAIKRNIVPIYWDNGNSADYGFALFDRNSGSILNQSLLSAIIAGKQQN